MTIWTVGCLGAAILSIIFDITTKNYAEKAFWSRYSIFWGVMACVSMLAELTK